MKTRRTLLLEASTIPLALLLLWGCEEGPRPLGGVQDKGAMKKDGPRSDQAASDRGKGDVAGPGTDGKPAGDQAAPDAAAGPWVKITSPADKSTVANPVTFQIAAAKVALVQILVDNYALSSPWDPKTKTSLTYTFTGTGYERTVVLKGSDTAGKELASHPIKITVSAASKGTQLPAQLKITYYYMAQEADYSGSATEALKDASCNTLATVSKSFYDALCIEGSGRLKDGRVVNYAKTCSCAAQCAYGSKTCYSVLDKTKFPWGAGASSNALVPLRSWAVDKSLIPLGTVLYVPAWDGVAVPKVDGIGGFTHDGCFRADDVGGGVTGWHYDFFAGTKAMYQALSALSGGAYKTYTLFSVYKNPPGCASLKP